MLPQVVDAGHGRAGLVVHGNFCTDTPDGVMCTATQRGPKETFIVQCTANCKGPLANQEVQADKANGSKDKDSGKPLQQVDEEEMQLEKQKAKAREKMERQGDKQEGMQKDKQEKHEDKENETPPKRGSEDTSVQNVKQEQTCEPNKLHYLPCPFKGELSCPNSYKQLAKASKKLTSAQNATIPAGIELHVQTIDCQCTDPKGVPCNFKGQDHIDIGSDFRACACSTPCNSDAEAPDVPPSDKVAVVEVMRAEYETYNKVRSLKMKPWTDTFIEKQKNKTLCDRPGDLVRNRRCTEHHPVNTLNFTTPTGHENAFGDREKAALLCSLRQHKGIAFGDNDTLENPFYHAHAAKLKINQWNPKTGLQLDSHDSSSLPGRCSNSSTVPYGLRFFKGGPGCTECFGHGDNCARKCNLNTSRIRDYEHIEMIDFNLKRKGCPAYTAAVKITKARDTSTASTLVKGTTAVIPEAYGSVSHWGWHVGYGIPCGCRKKKEQQMKDGVACTCHKTPCWLHAHGPKKGLQSGCQGVCNMGMGTYNNETKVWKDERPIAKCEKWARKMDTILREEVAKLRFKIAKSLLECTPVFKHEYPCIYEDRGWSRYGKECCSSSCVPKCKGRVAAKKAVEERRKLAASAVTSGKVKYLGCYQDRPQRDLVHSKGTGKTVTGCMEACRDFKYFALQGRGECRCDNSYMTHPTEAKRNYYYGKKKDSECGAACPPSCTGAGWRNAVYEPLGRAKDWKPGGDRNSETNTKPGHSSTRTKKGELISGNKPTAQSSTGYGGSSGRAVDGNIATSWSSNSCTHTRKQQNPWWRVNLQKTMTVKSVKVYNRGDCCGDRLSRFEVSVAKSDQAASKDKTKCGGKHSVAQGQSKTIDCGNAKGQYVLITAPGRKALTLCEVQVHGSP